MLLRTPSLSVVLFSFVPQMSRSYLCYAASIIRVMTEAALTSAMLVDIYQTQSLVFSQFIPQMIGITYVVLEMAFE